MKHRTIRGKIRYVSKQKERMNEERGREFFTLTKQYNGVEVLHAHTEIDDAPNVIRDITLAMKNDSTPLDCHVRLTVDDKLEGTGWIRFDNNYAECESYTKEQGRVHEKVEFEQKIDWLQTHPVYADALLMRLYDLSKGPGKQFFPNIMFTSPDVRGATGPKLFKTGFGIRYIGQQEISVIAGKFLSHHFQVVDTAGNLPEEHPPYNLWCTADDNYIFLKAQLAGHMQTEYELVELVKE